MSRNIRLLGADTRLGIKFEELATRREYSIDDFSRPYNWIVNCEGENHLSRIGETPSEDGALLLTNVMPIYWEVNNLIAKGHPAARVLNIASQTYRIPQTHTALYCASKAALVMLTRVMARELAPKGWVINALAPGKIEDTRMAQLTDRQVEELRGWNHAEAEGYALRNIPMRRYTTREEVCDAMFKVLDLPAYINGTCIDMTGGA